MASTTAQPLAAHSKSDTRDGNDRAGQSSRRYRIIGGDRLGDAECAGNQFRQIANPHDRERGSVAIQTGKTNLLAGAEGFGSDQAGRNFIADWRVKDDGPRALKTVAGQK